MAIHYFSQEHKIEFRSLRDLSQIIHSFSTGSLNSIAMCAASPSTLLFVDRSDLPNHVYWLDCTEDEPKLTGKKISTELDFIWDICYIRDEKKPLLVGGNGENVFAYDVVTNKLKWITLGRGDSVTTDGHEYVLVRTANSIRLLSLSDGKDLGYLIRQGDKGLGYLGQMQCTTSSFVVGHARNEMYHISTIQFE